MAKTQEIYPQEIKNTLNMLWHSNPQEWKQYNTIRNHLRQHLKNKKISDRTIIRYINQLVNDAKYLEKRIEPNHRTWYRPNQELFTKHEIKNNIDSLPLVITQENLKIHTPNQTETNMFPSPIFSAAFESKTVDKWKNKLEPKIKEYLKTRYPDINKQELELNTNLFLQYFFDFIEANLKLAILTNLKLPPINASKWTTLIGKTKKNIYAKIWQHLFEAITLLLFNTFEQYEKLEDFINNTENTKMQLLLEANTNFKELLEKVLQAKAP
jgi:hypothetical protein